MAYQVPKNLEFIVFEDHVEGSKDIAPCGIIGEVIFEDKKKIVIRNWFCYEGYEVVDDKANDKYWAIIKSTVLKRFSLDLKKRR